MTYSSHDLRAVTAYLLHHGHGDLPGIEEWNEVAAKFFEVETPTEKQVAEVRRCVAFAQRRIADPSQAPELWREMWEHLRAAEPAKP